MVELAHVRVVVAALLGRTGARDAQTACVGRVPLSGVRSLSCDNFCINLSRPCWSDQLVRIDRRLAWWLPGPRAKPRKLRPAVVVEDDELFPEEHPNMLAVPLTSGEGLVHRSFAEQIEPTAGNGAGTTCWALAHHVTGDSLHRINATASRITAESLSSIRKRIMVAVGAA